MSYISEKTNSSNLTNEIESEFKFSNYYKTIFNKSNKMTNTLIRKTSGLNSRKSSTIISLNKREKELSNNLNELIEENKNSLLFKDIKANRLNMLFKNLLIREKQKNYRKNTVQVTSYNMCMKKEELKKAPFIVKNNSSLLQSFLKQTKSNFNNKYKVIYSISDWKQKNKIKTLLNSIKKYQHKNDFPDCIKGKLIKRFSSAKTRIKSINKIIDNKNSNYANKNETSLNNYLQKDYLKDIFHKNNLIKLKTLNEIKNNSKPNILRKSNTDIFYSNNTLFKTMPFDKLKMKKRRSFI